MITVYGANISPFVRKVRVFLAEKGISYKLEPVNPFAGRSRVQEDQPVGQDPGISRWQRHLGGFFSHLCVRREDQSAASIDSGCARRLRASTVVRGVWRWWARTHIWWERSSVSVW